MGSLESRVGTRSLTSPAGRCSVTAMQEQWYLEGFLDGKDGIQRVPIVPLPFIIGRQRDLSFPLPSGSVSRRHVEIYLDGPCLRIRDLGSTNGTFVNGQRIATDQPLDPGDVIRIGMFEFRVAVERVGDSGVNTTSTAMMSPEEQQRLGIGVHGFERLFQLRAVAPAYQPVVNLATSKIIGYEILGRGTLPGLPCEPNELFRIATMFHKQRELSELFRVVGVEEVKSKAFDRPMNLFANTHPVEMEGPGLVDSLRALRARFGSMPLTLEIHEGTITDLQAMRELRRELTDLSIKLAYDDFGAEHGEGRLLQIADVPPDYLKFDVVWIRDIDRAPANRQWMLENLVQMALRMGIAPLAEGVETEAEADICAAVGFRFAQGFHYGRPVSVHEL
jgi:EAL domain-containing protein (putative c-di-GMP-specific phosphodiesterase class I)